MKIKVMSENLANKIAAGEVIEKCASVVKELVENSIDAKADCISIDLIDSGIKEIKVTDNGVGMSKEDALLCFQRHATSKLLKEDDLFFINTLGFRGEALPSIASVSEIVLETNAGDIGTLIHLKGGTIVNETISSIKKGTRIQVNNLFYNTPARLKYLKSDNTELAYSTSLIEKLALSYPNIKFTLTNNDTELIKTSGSNDLLKTIHEIYGIKISSNMLAIRSSNDDFDISGYICKPEILKSNRNHLITLVNGRVIRNNELNSIINDAYYTYKPVDKYPVVVINIYVDPTLVDVNIHPTKQDIKISKIDFLRELLCKTIKDALYSSLLIPKIKNYNEEKSSIIEEKIINYEATNVNVVMEEQTSFDFSVKEEIPNLEHNEEIKELVLYPVGLLLGTYIAAQNEDGIYLIDQHAAQERINYEKYFKALKNKEITRTSMLFPISIELSKTEYLILKERMDILTNMGFSIEEFGINTILIKEHPTWLKEGYEEESIRKIIDLIIINKDFNGPKFNEKVAITLACKMSVKGNENISLEAMDNLLKDLVKTDNPYNCPHGRPTIISFSKYELEKMFKRAM